MSSRARQLLIAIAVSAFASGCGCLSMKGAESMNEELVARNRARAEPAMLAAAQHVGATLLSTKAYDVQIAPMCQGLGPPCLERIDGGEGFARVRDERGTLRLAIRVPLDGLSYARLAQRGNKLFVLAPKVIEREVARKTQCECDGMPKAYVPNQAAFLIDDLPNVEVTRLSVPMTEDFIRWKCTSFAA